jgi:hypothetical protein
MMSSFFLTVPARNLRTLCCQSVAWIIYSMLAPSGWLNSVSTRSYLVPRKGQLSEGLCP